jgi:hypothetical protein
MRAFVEVDTTVGFTCLDMGLQLAKEWAEVCHIQIVGLLPSPSTTALLGVLIPVFSFRPRGALRFCGFNRTRSKLQSALRCGFPLKRFCRRLCALG